MRLVPVAALLGFSLVACGSEPPPVPPEAPRPPAAPAAPEAPATPPPPAGAERLAFVDQAGEPRLLLDCLGGPRPALRASVAEFRKIGSEDRLTLGAGNEAFALVADLADPSPGVVASGAIDLDLLRRIGDRRPVSAVYGAQSVGPLRPADGMAPDGFVVRCRALAGPQGQGRAGDQAQP
ncbi:hypothetical protein [Brevundimonas viscosa]|uniref:Lipoprotein n=1 Tax=Brevundimonas viscosa TaxID=871741 RepID=A0A1I6P475_9CAUL|nr:hypothetical protein [Brevundimonas viscosa]SFS35026.1 hypothetical protein SAMN05192570_0825 [Brevundimonas viscosa]